MRFGYLHFLRTAAAGALLLFGSLGNASATDEGRAWRFKVFLDDKAIGWHTFELSPADGRLRSEARYDVKFLFITAYSYAHEATELWDGRCLTRMDAYTDNNGKVSSLQGRRDDGGFVVEVQNKQEQLPGCVQSFAYWDPSILSATRLLNAQTGEYVPVETTRLGRQQISVRGDQVQAQAWRIQARKMQIDLWYSDDGEWLALQAPTESGRVLRYEIQ